MVLIITSIASVRMVEIWESCQHNFNAWSLSIICLMITSLLLNFVQAYSVKHMKVYV